MPEPKLVQSLQQSQQLRGRLLAARWLSLTEPELAREFAGVEGDPLFGELLYGSGALRRKRWPASRLHAGFYELNEQTTAGRGSGDISDLLEKKQDLVRLLRRVGQPAFERAFLEGEPDTPFPELCRKLKIKEAEGRRILDLMLDVGARSEFFAPATAPGRAARGSSVVARIEKDPRDAAGLYFMFMAPHWARGRYELDYDKLEAWKKRRALAAPERRRLKAMLKKMELLNMRQDTLFQILSRVTTAQTAYLSSRLESRRRPLSLRELARRLGVAASTVSRAVGSRSVELPWGEQVPLKSLLSGQHTVVVSILAQWIKAGEAGEGISDEKLMRRLAEEHGISVSRRTVNDCRRQALADAV